MKIKTSELKGTALDWAVSKCEGWEPIDYSGNLANIWVQRLNKRGVMEHGQPLRYSTDWSQGGPIIEREKIQINPSISSNAWGACNPSQGQCVWVWAATPLIAAMRSFVISKLGNEIEIPDELIQ